MVKGKNKADNFMNYVPKKKHDNWEIRNGKVYLIFYHEKFIERAARWLIKKPYVSDVELDELGSEVWKLINGENTVYDIGQEILSSFGEKCEPVYDRLIMYLRYLSRKAWISFDRGDQVS